jgi:hypothetical protein
MPSPFFNIPENFTPFSYRLKHVSELIGFFPSPRLGFGNLSAMQNNTFCFFFQEKEGLLSSELFPGGTPPDPQDRLRRILGSTIFQRSRTNAFASFLEKKNVIVP